MSDIQYSKLYYLLKSLNYIYNKLLLPINFDFNDVVKYDLNDKQSEDVFFENINKFEKYISNFYINSKLRFNNCLIDSNLINISDTNNYFICINNILDVNCLAFNTNLFYITYDNNFFYYKNNFHSINFSKQKFYLYFFNLFFNNNFYFFILSPNYRYFNDNKKFLLNLLPYIDYNIKNTFDTSLFNFLSLNIDVEFLYVPIIYICPLYFKYGDAKTFIDVSLILIIYFFQSREKFYTNFNYVIDNLKNNDAKDKDRKLVFFYLLYIFIFIYISNTITSFDEIGAFRILNSDTSLVEFKFIYKCAYLFNLYFINFLYKLTDLSNNYIKIKSYIRDDIIKSCNIENTNYINEFRKFHTDPDVNIYLMYLLNECIGYQTEKNDVFNEIGLSKVVTITKVIQKYVVSSDDNYFSNENISDKVYSNKFEEMYKSNNDDFDFNVYNILYQI